MAPVSVENASPAESERTVSIWPWQAQSHRAWSLLDMIESFHAKNFGIFLINFERCCAHTEMILDPPPLLANREMLLRGAIPQYRESLSGILDTCANSQIPISYAVQKQIERLYERLDNAQDSDFVAITEHARLVRQAILDDLEQHLFFFVPTQYRAFVDQPNPFGERVASVFADANRDIQDACRCLAFGEWTACIFHLMRTLEHGLRQMAERFGVTFTVDSWHKVIKGIEDGIAALRNKPSLTEKDRNEITYYSEAAAQFRYFKDTWRNHVSHSREHYDERDAETVLAHVREFMQHMAA